MCWCVCVCQSVSQTVSLLMHTWVQCLLSVCIFPWRTVYGMTRRRYNKHMEAQVVCLYVVKLAMIVLCSNLQFIDFNRYIPLFRFFFHFLLYFVFISHFLNNSKPLCKTMGRTQAKEKNHLNPNIASYPHWCFVQTNGIEKMWFTHSWIISFFWTS